MDQTLRRPSASGGQSGHLAPEDAGKLQGRSRGCRGAGAEVVGVRKRRLWGAGSLDTELE